MAQAMSLCPLVGFLSGRVSSVVNLSSLVRHSLLHQSLLPRRCLNITPNPGHQIKLFHHFRSSPGNLRRNLLNRHQITLRPKDSNLFCSQGKSTPKKDGLTETENIRYWETFEAEMKKLTLVQRYKKMAKEFWYVGIPVVGITSAMWLGTFYLIAASGSVKPLVSKLRDYGVPETIAKALESEKMGPLAIAIVMYKLATPARYAVSIAGTVQAIKILLKRGLIKPVPSKDQLKQIVLKKVQEKSKPNQ